MSETGAAAAQRYRSEMRDKAARLGGGEDAKRVDSSEFEPGEKLYAGVKTGMRPVSRQARRDGGPVHGESSPLGAHALKRPGRAPRKAGGGVEAEVGKGYVNRDAKAANAEREGEYPNGGMKAGGRAERAGGGYIRREERPGGNFTEALKRKTASQAIKPGDGRPAAEDGRLGRASGGRTGRQAGGPLSTPLAAGMGGQGRMSFNYGPQTSTASKLGLRDGGRAKAHERYGHGPSCSCPSCRKGKAGGGGLGMLGGLIPMAIDEIGGGDGDNKTPSLTPKGPGQKAGGRVGRANGGAAPGPAENDATRGSVRSPMGHPAKGEHLGAIGQPSLRHRAPHGENNSRDKTLTAAGARTGRGVDANQGRQRSLLRADGGRADDADGPRKPGPLSPSAKAEVERVKGEMRSGKGLRYPGRGGSGPPYAAGGEVAKGALKQHRLEHKALDTKARARGGKTGKTNINIVIAPGGQGQGGLPPPGANPQLGIRPPQPAAPMPMPAPGGAPAGPPTPMPIPIPMGAGAAPGMPPRARGGRAPQVRGEPEAGGGSGLGRLQKLEEYGHRSREGEGLRK